MGGSARERRSSNPQTKKAFESLSTFLLLPVHLSIHIPGSSVLSIANSYELVAAFAPDAKLILLTVSEFHSVIKYPTTLNPIKLMVRLTITSTKRESEWF